MNTSDVTEQSQDANAGCVQRVVMRRANSCSNCRHLVKRDMTLMSYHVKATCNKGVWEGGEYTGDGDYAENDTEKQVCDLHEGA